MMLTNKMAPAEQPSDVLFSTLDVQDLPDSTGLDGTGFSGLFSSMVAAQSGGGRKIESLPLDDATAPLNSLNAMLNPALEPAKKINDVDVSSLGLSRLELLQQNTPLDTPDTEQVSDLSAPYVFSIEGGGENLITSERLKGNAVSTNVLLEEGGVNLGTDQAIEVSPQALNLAFSSAQAEVLNHSSLVEPNVIKESMVSNPALNQATGSVSSSNLGTSQLSQPSQSVVQGSTVSWGAQSSDAQTSQGFGQQGQSSGQPSQNGSGQTAQQQAMMFAQMSQGKQQSLEQQAAVRAMDDAVSKTEGRELLGGAEIASLDRKGNLPLGLQTINVPVKHPQWGQALGQRIVFMSNNGLQQAQITLNPQNLGQIQVMLQLDKDQQMHVSLVAQNGATRESMENALPRLREMMEQAGIQLASVNISDQKQFSESGDAQEHHGQGASKNTLVEEDKAEDRPLLMTGSTDNIIDYYA